MSGLSNQPQLFHLVDEDAYDVAGRGLSGELGSDQQNLIEEMNVIALRLDPQGLIRSANRRALAVIGSAAGELQGTRVQGLISCSTTAGGARITMRRLLATPHRYPTFQTQLVLQDKRRLWVKWSSTAVYGADGSLIELLWVGMDISELKQSEQGLLAYQQQLQTLTVHSAVVEARERQSMADAIHEDIAQDLAYWRLQLAALQKELQSPEATSGMGRVVEGVGTLIQRLRDFAFQLSPTILYRIGLKSAISCLAEQVSKRHGLTVKVESNWLEEELPEEVRLVVYQAVRELLMNAATHGAATEIRVTLEGSGGELLVEVSDNGVGFDPQLLQPGRKSRGLGLMSLQQMVAHLGGRLLINSSPGQGACLTVVVPHPEAHPDTPGLFAVT